jgi:hypothetical protein
MTDHATLNTALPEVVRELYAQFGAADFCLAANERRRANLMGDAR